MIVEEAFSSLCSELVGIPISHVWQGHGSAIFFELGALTPMARKDGTPGNPKGEIGLSVEWSWRVEANRSIIFGSWSDEEHWQPTFDRVRGELITNFELFGALPEVIIETSGGVRFLSFSTAEGQPQWSVVDRRGAVTKSFYVNDGNLIVDLETEK